MTAIKVFRAPAATEDRWGDAQPPAKKSWPVWKTVEGAVSWGTSQEPLEPGRNTVIQPRDVYLELGAPSGILATDEVEIDGDRYIIIGKVAEWEEGGEFVGTHFRIRGVSDG